jgi:nicotinate-nucleotide--dimethylbenzimidazole phosphoribosyltransferase
MAEAPSFTPQEQLARILRDIRPRDAEAMRIAQARQDALTKPRGSLGRLEEISIQLAGMTSDPRPQVLQKVVVVMAADHGVVEEGVSAYPQAVTAQMVLNFVRGGAAICVLARHAGARLRIVDMGVAADLPPGPGLSIRKIGRGTRNLARAAAMSAEEALESVVTGITIAEEELALGADLIATGEMGIGNTTSAAAVATALLGEAPEMLAGRGTGIDDAGMQRKLDTIRRGLSVNRPDASDGLDVLCKVGGFEIGGLAGLILGTAAHRVPIVVDGFIATAAAMIAVKIAPHARDHLFASHLSSEHGHHQMLEWLGLDPLLRLNMRLGEGTGAALAMGLIEAAAKVLDEMATFEEAGVSKRSAEPPS